LALAPALRAMQGQRSLQLTTLRKQVVWLKLGLQLYGKFGICYVVARLVLGMLRRWRALRVLRDVPAVRTPVLPIMGMIPSILANRKRLHHWRMEAMAGLPVSKIVGPVWDPLVVIVNVLDPAGVKHLLKDAFDKYTKPAPERDHTFTLLTEFIGDGIFTAPHGHAAPDRGQLWLHQRKIAANIFSRANFNSNMHGVFVTKGQRLKGLLRSGEKVDMQKHFFSFTMDSIMQIFFGVESDTMGGEVSKYGQAFDTAHRCFFTYAIDSIGLMSLSGLLPWPLGGYNGACCRLHRLWSATYREFRRNTRILDTESRTLIDKCRCDRNQGKRTDLLALFMQAAEGDGLPVAKSAEYLRDMVLNFVIAGRDTTACTLSWTFYILSTHPDIQKRVQAEIDEKLPAGTIPTLKLVHHTNMPLLHALLYESLRLYPPVPFDVKEARCDDVLPDGSRVPRHAKMWFIPYVMGRNADVYPEPERVHLERWVPFKQPPSHEFPVFQAGPRLCLGMDMAIFEAKVLTAMLLQDFSFTLAAGEAEKIHYSLMLTMSVCNSKEQDSHNLWLIPEQRTARA